MRKILTLLSFIKNLIILSLENTFWILLTKKDNWQNIRQQKFVYESIRGCSLNFHFWGHLILGDHQTWNTQSTMLPKYRINTSFSESFQKRFQLFVYKNHLKCDSSLPRKTVLACPKNPDGAEINVHMITIKVMISGKSLLAWSS